MQWSIEQAQAYLAAMIDGEGWVGEYRNVSWNRAIRISNTDPEIIQAIVECLKLLGIKHSVTDEKRYNKPEHWSDQQKIEITGHAALSYVLENVPFQASRKRGRLERLVQSFKIIPPIDEAELRRLYLDEKMTDNQVAQAMNVGKKRIILARQKYGIPGHSRTDRAPMIWAKRRERYGKHGRPRRE